MDPEPKRRLLFEPEEPKRSAFGWLVALTILACATGGAVFAWTQMHAVYTAAGHLSLEAQDRSSHAPPDPLRTDLDPRMLVALFRSDDVLARVAYHERLFLEVERGNVDMLQGLWLADAIRPGTYEMRVSISASHFMLTTGDGTIVQQGRLGNGTVGEDIGLRWTPGPGRLPPGARVRFRVLMPGDAARRLNERLRLRMTPDNTLSVSMDGADPEDTSRIVNALMDRVVEVVGQRQGERRQALLRALVRNVSRMEGQLGQLEKSARHTPDDRLLDTRVDATRAAYVEQRQHLEETRKQVSSAKIGVAILDYAPVPGRPSTDERMLVLFTFLSGVVGTLGVVLLPQDRYTVQSRIGHEDFESDVDDGLAVAGVLVGALGAAMVTALLVL